MVLTAKQRKFLKSLAHPLSPVVRVGRAGLTDAVVKETGKALLAHELIKVRVESDDGAERKDLAAALAVAADAQIAGRIGKIVMLYRAREEKPGIKLPK